MTWKERWHRRICAFWWSFKFGRHEKSFNLSSTGIRPHHLLVILPPAFDYFDVARHKIEPLIEHMQPRFTTLLVPENFRTWLSRDLEARVLPYDYRKKNYLGFPEQGFCRKVSELETDVVVDLMPEFNPYTAGLTGASQAPLRISLDCRQEPGFYNIFIEFDEGTNLGERYETLLKYV